MEVMDVPQQRHRRRRSASKEMAFNNRKIYDPRRWHKRSTSGLDVGGRPPAGWVLIWTGRFKRWRRRWFVANPPGLLLHYKNSDQVGRHGRISLLGATVVPATGKERQFKIIKGNVVYYLRTISRDYRKPWLDAIQESIQLYQNSVQRVSGGAEFGSAVLPQPSVPSHKREDWEAQERDLKRRLRERMRDLEPTRNAFLDQLQTLQQSLSTISGVLGFSDHPEVPAKFTTTSGLPAMPCLPETNWRSNEMFMAEHEASESDGMQLQSVTPVQGYDKISSPEMVVASPYRSLSRPISPQMLRFQESYHHRRNGSPVRAQKSVFTLNSPGEKKFRRDRRRSSDFSVDERLEDDPEEMSCIRAECFPGRKRSVHGNASDTDSGSKTHPKKFSSPLHRRKRNGDFAYISTPTSSQELDARLMKKSEKDCFERQKKEMEGSSRVSASRTCGVPWHGEINEEGSTGPGRSLQGPLHAAWNNMQDSYNEVLKDEIYRVLELEAENAVLQQALRSLPQLQQDRAALLSMRERRMKGNHCESGRKIMSDDSIQANGEDSEEDIAIVHADVGNEEYFEALEVLNHHDFAARGISSEEHDSLAVITGGNEEPSEETETGDADFLSEAEGEEIDQPRRRLPAPRPLSRGFTLWTVLKNAVGRDLNHITLPATINEPLSVLQKCAEELQYRRFLEQAVQTTDSLERLIQATAFTCASYYGSIHRDAKPFNPLLGETFEFQDSRSWFLAEQVSHHPPILAFQSESTEGSYKLYGEIEIKNKFWGRSIEVLCNGGVHLRIPKYGDHFTWNRATLCIHNIVVGKTWIDNYGEVTVVNHSTGETSRVRFHKASSREQCRISGKVYDAKGIPHYTIFGNYMEAIYVCPESCTNFDVNGPDVRLLWKAPEQIKDYRQQYCFTRYTLGLNELTPKLRKVLPPTDTRFRPDQRALEDGNLELATPEKLRLEEKQRIARRVRKENGVEWQNMWFAQREAGVEEVKPIDANAEPTWVWKGTYWDAREKQAWENCPDIM